MHRHFVNQWNLVFFCDIALLFLGKPIVTNSNIYSQELQIFR